MSGCDFIGIRANNAVAIVLASYTQAATFDAAGSAGLDAAQVMSRASHLARNVYPGVHIENGHQDRVHHLHQLKEIRGSDFVRIDRGTEAGKFASAVGGIFGWSADGSPRRASGFIAEHPQVFLTNAHSLYDSKQLRWNTRDGTLKPSDFEIFIHECNRRYKVKAVVENQAFIELSRKPNAERAQLRSQDYAAVVLAQPACNAAVPSKLLACQKRHGYNRLAYTGNGQPISVAAIGIYPVRGLNEFRAQQAQEFGIGVVEKEFSYAETPPKIESERKYRAHINDHSRFATYGNVIGLVSSWRGDFIVKYQASLLGGGSGGPIIVRNNDRPVVIAMAASHGSKSEIHNYATPITQDIVNMVTKAIDLSRR